MSHDLFQNRNIYLAIKEMFSKEDCVAVTNSWTEGLETVQVALLLTYNVKL